ncbi:hypothetical protein QYM36_003955 [Artemia franciscana]|uniref:Uncharacterized protein n=1 Tax=Artemia franciscana TaxID=6661 RepID=A0AA88L801_ARTSF|nr:hypothetical protein QYM36_003955 [Artemia franciscana]
MFLMKRAKDWTFLLISCSSSYGSDENSNVPVYLSISNRKAVDLNINHVDSEDIDSEKGRFDRAYNNFVSELLFNSTPEADYVNSESEVIII